MARLSQREKHQRTKQIFWGSLLIIIVVLVITSAGYHSFNKSEGLNPDTLCPTTGPKGHYVLLIDTTDQLSFTQHAAFEVTLRDLIEKRVPEGYLFSVFVMGEDFKECANPLVELCNPGTGEEKSELTANIKQLKRQYKEKFLDFLINKSSNILNSKAANTSPVFEMIQMVSINSFRKHDVKGKRHLIVISDMLHNTSQFSMYKGIVDYQIFASSDYGRKLQLELNDVEVEIHYLINNPRLQTKRNLKFWEDYFHNAGASIVAVRPLEG